MLCVCMCLCVLHVCMCVCVCVCVYVLVQACKYTDYKNTHNPFLTIEGAMK